MSSLETSELIETYNHLTTAVRAIDMRMATASGSSLDRLTHVGQEIEDQLSRIASELSAKASDSPDIAVGMLRIVEAHIIEALGDEDEHAPYISLMSRAIALIDQRCGSEAS